MTTENKPLLGRCSTFIACIALMILQFALLQPVATAADVLPEKGEWQGKLVPYDSTELEKIVYQVGRSADTDKLTIKMINMTLEPRSEFTYELYDIEIVDNNLKFKIPKEFEIEDCLLEYVDDNTYSGTCTSNAGAVNELSILTMIRPKPKLQEGQAEKGSDSNAGHSNKQSVTEDQSLESKE